MPDSTVLKGMFISPFFFLFSFPFFRTNFVQEVNPIETTNNSDINLFHDETTFNYDIILFNDDTQITLFDLQPEETPDWASSMFFLSLF